MEYIYIYIYIYIGHGIFMDIEKARGNSRGQLKKFFLSKKYVKPPCLDFLWNSPIIISNCFSNRSGTHKKVQV